MAERNRSGSRILILDRSGIFDVKCGGICGITNSSRSQHMQGRRVHRGRRDLGLAATASSTVIVEEVAATFSGLVNPFAEEAAASKLFAMEINRLTVKAARVEGDWGSWKEGENTMRYEVMEVGGREENVMVHHM